MRAGAIGASQPEPGLPAPDGRVTVLATFRGLSPTDALNFSRDSASGYWESLDFFLKMQHIRWCCL